MKNSRFVSHCRDGTVNASVLWIVSAHLYIYYIYLYTYIYNALFSICTKQANHTCSQATCCPSVPLSIWIADATQIFTLMVWCVKMEILCSLAIISHPVAAMQRCDNQLPNSSVCSQPNGPSLLAATLQTDNILVVHTFPQHRDKCIIVAVIIHGIFLHFR